MQPVDTLFLCSDIEFYKGLEQSGYCVKDIYTKLPRFLRIMRRVHMGLHLPLQSIWYGKWKKHVRSYKNIIISDVVLNTAVLPWIYKKSPFSKLFFFRINLVNHLTHPDRYPSGICSEWSFDKGDCEKYGFQHIHTSTFYLTSFHLPKAEREWDVFFLGRDKGRYEKLQKIKSDLEQKGLRIKYHIVRDSRHNHPTGGETIYTKLLTYTENLGFVARSAAILDIVQEGQSGLTLRVMESLFLQKKLITNNPDILNYDFYHPDNIYVLGIDSPDSIKSFITSAYVPIDGELIEKYTLDNVLQYMISHSEK